MAKFQLGAFVTEISGSIGGTTFKNSPTGPIMMNKMRGASRNKTLTNPRLGQLGEIFTAWKNLNYVQRSAWKDAAGKYEVPSKSGGTKILTPRQFFTKMASQLLPSSYGIPLGTDFETNLGVFSMSDLYVDLGTGDVLVQLNITGGQSNLVLLQVELFKGTPRAPTFIARKVIFSGLYSSPTVVNLIDPVTDEFPNYQQFDWIRIYGTPMTTTGWRGVTQIIEGPFTTL